MSNKITAHWKAPEGVSLPNFIIGGAMKSGTSSLHAILAQHPRVFIPKEEIGFFDIDNLIEHYDFNFYDPTTKQWTTQDMENDSKALWQWYGSKFEEANGRIKGEDSTSYLTSKFAAERIAIQNEEIKLLFMLRQPSKRAFSNYHHLVRSGTVAHSFEDVLQMYPNSVLGRSLYKEQLEAYYNCIKKENIQVVIFEDLIENPKQVISKVCEFLGLDVTKFDPSVFETHTNKAKFPKFSGLHKLKNSLFRRYGSSFYLNTLPVKASRASKRRLFLAKAANRAHGIINPLSVRKSPKMNPSTQQFLDVYFEKQLQGLDELVGESILDKWFNK